MSRTATRLAAVSSLALVGAVTGLISAPTASAQDLPKPVASVSTVKPGQQITLTGTGCLATQDETPIIAVGVDQPDGPDLWGARTGYSPWAEPAPDGSWSLTFTFGKGTLSGTYPVTATCSRYNDILFAPPVNISVIEGVGAIRGVAANTTGTKSVSTDKTTGDTSAPGQKVVKVIAGFQPFEEVTLVLHSTPTTLGTFSADAKGVLTVEFTLPAGTAVGTHTLVFDGAVTYYQEPLEVTKAGSANLAYTGADMTVPLTLGVGLVLAGAGALVVSRRKAGAAQA